MICTHRHNSCQRLDGPLRITIRLLLPNHHVSVRQYTVHDVSAGCQLLPISTSITYYLLTSESNHQT